MPPPEPGEGKTPEEWVEEMENAETGESAGMESADIAGESAGMDSADIAAIQAAASMDVNEVAAAAMEVVDEVTNAAPTVNEGGSDGMVAEDSSGKMVAKRLTPERKKMLEDLGFVWSLRSKRVDDHWDEMYRQLEEYKEKHGVCNLCVFDHVATVSCSQFSQNVFDLSAPIGLSGAVPIRGMVQQVNGRKSCVVCHTVHLTSRASVCRRTLS